MSPDICISRRARTQTDTCWIWGVLALAGILRAIALLWPGAFANDPDSYQRVAANCVEKGIFALDDRPTAFRPPLYPLTIAGVMRLSGPYWRTGLGVLHWLLGLGTVACVLALAVPCWGRWGSVLASFLIACDPILLHHSRLIMTETLSAFLVAVTLLVLDHADNAGRFALRGWWLLAGVCVGLCALARPTFLAWPFLAVALTVMCACKRDNASQPDASAASASGRPGRGCVLRKALFPWQEVGWIWQQAGWLFLGLCLTLAPWVARNAVRFGKPILGTTHGGYTFYLANNPWFYRFLQQPDSAPVWDAAEFNRHWQRTVAGLPDGEPSADRLAYRLAWQTIRAQPVTFLRSCWHRFLQFWRPAPNRTVEHESLRSAFLRYAIGVFYILEYALAVIAVWHFLRLPFKTHSVHEMSPRVKMQLENQKAPGVETHLPGETAKPPHTAQQYLKQTLDVNEKASSRYSLWTWSAALVITLTVIHTVYWSNMRMRAPIQPVFALLAAAGLSRWLAGSKRCDG